MDNASDYGSEDSRFESWQARILLISKIVSFIQHCYWERKPLTRLQRIVFTWEEICAFKLLISSPKRNNARCLFGHMYSKWACGAMDNASDYGSEDSRFDSWQARNIFKLRIMSFKSRLSEA